MESVKKWLSERKNKDGLYIHRSPPKVVGAIPAAQLRQWARGGSEGRLERLVLAGQGRRLLTEAGSLPISHHLPSLVAKCDALHTAVENGSLLELQELLHLEYNRQKLVTCKDEAGVGLLHKSVYFDFTDITEWLVANFPQLVNQRDSAGRTALHYAVVNRDEASTAGLLEGAGARVVRDEAGRTPASYRGAARTLLTLPRKADMAPVSRKPGQTIKRHQIRIWCHDCDMARLQRIVWEGHGSQLLSEVSNQPVVKKFLEAVPYMMNTVRDIHTAVVQNDLEGLMRLSGDPVPPQILSSRDINNMTVMHKAAGLGHNGIMKYLAERYPEGVNDEDNDGRTPLHYAAAVRDEQHTFNTLVELGADESIVDNKKKTPGYYVNRAQEIDKSLLKVIPDAPRTASSAYPSSWDWKLLDTELISQLNKKSRRKNKGSSENVSTKNNTNTISENTESRTMKTSSTHEFIKDLPELEESKIKNNEEEDEIPHMEELLQEENTENDEDHDANEHVEEENKSEASEEINTFDENVGNDDETKKAENEDPDHADPAEIEEAYGQHESALEKTEDVVENQQVEEDENSKGEENISDNEKHFGNETDNAENTSNQEDNVNEENENTKNEGNINGEDDDDVQIPGDTNSEYSDIHLKSTAEASSKSGSAKRGNLINGRNTQESLIEGIISGEAEQDSQDASITQKDGSVHGDVLVVDSEIDPEITDLINTANMEMLATLVLNGEGARLLGRRSGNTELQAFLDNVPTYMQKIKNVHTAAKEGNIRNLQAALDRRKFAIARDPISANGATPLHVATIFGKTNIMKYLGGRFPETLSAVDFEGRTALHYAAALPDNGHYYSILQQLGANSKDLDDSGNSAANYLETPSLLPLTQLLSDFGLNEDEANHMFSDKGTTHDVNGHMDIPVFRTNEGRYLAKSLGDPLIKGLTEVANTKPKDPIAFLASFLHNFPEREKPPLGTQESNMVVSEEAEVENDQPAQPERGLTATRPRPIEVVTVDPQQMTSPDGPEAAFSSSSRDEHGQSMLHFAAARTHTRNALFQLLQESDISLGYRDELYRTARDVSIQANIKENTVEIDRFVLHLAARGNTEKIMELLLEGYDHILDTVDEDGLSVTDVVALRGDPTMGNLIASIPAFEESRESLHGAVRRGSLETVSATISAEGGRTLARGQNSFGRTALHVAVLAQHEHIVEHLSQTYPELLRIGDNLERTPLHYAMGVEKIESISRVLIKAGAKRVLKDLKGRQPTYYFMNKSDILRLKEEEEIY